MRYSQYLFASAFTTHAFILDTYAESSVLSSGRWIKVSVTESGLHIIPTSTLRAWGFSDPSAVRIFGYGGARISDQLSRANYVDDLPVVKSELTANGIVFYAQGPGVWKQERDDIFTHSLNPYSTKGYYFLTDSRPNTDSSISTEGGSPTDGAATTFTERIYHELDLVTPAESGHQLVGEDFRYTSNRTFNFQLPGNAADSVWMQCDFFAKSTSSPSSSRSQPTDRNWHRPQETVSLRQPNGDVPQPYANASPYPAILSHSA